MQLCFRIWKTTGVLVKLSSVNTEFLVVNTEKHLDIQSDSSQVYIATLRCPVFNHIFSAIRDYENSLSNIFQIGFLDDKISGVEWFYAILVQD